MSPIIVARSILSFSKSHGGLRRSAYKLLAVAVYVLLALFVFFRSVPENTSIGLVFALIFAISPVLIWLATRWPLVFPFCAYVLIMPLDSLSRLSSFGTLTKLLGILSAIALLIRIMHRRDPLPAPRIVQAWLALLAWMAVTEFWAPLGAESLSALSQYVTLFALFAIVSITPVTKRELLAVLSSILIAGVAASAYQIYLFHSGQSVVPGESRVEIVVGGARIDPNEYAAALVLPTSIALYFLFKAKSRLAGIVMFAALAILLGGLASSGSRGGALAVMTAFTYLIVKSQHRLKVLFMLSVSVGGAVLFNPHIVERFQEASTHEGTGRGDIWRTGFRAFQDHWLAGWGVGAFPDAFDAAHLLVFMRFLRGWHWHAHNAPLTVLVELGVIGFALWSVVLWTQFTTASVVGRSNPLFELRLTLEAAFLGVFVAGLFTANLNAKYVWLCYATIAILRGYQLTCARGQRTNELRQVGRVTQSRATRTPAASVLCLRS